VTNEQLFDSVFKCDGGRFDLGIWPDSPFRDFILAHQCRISTTITSLTQGLGLTVHFDWVDNWTVNAGACLRDGVYLLGIHIGVPFLFDQLFSRMLADSRTLGHVGTQSVESDDLETFEDFTLDAGEAIRRHPKIHRPKDTVRAEYAARATMLVMDFLVLHELTHILHGHTDFDVFFGGLSLRLESRRAMASKAGFLTDLTLEWDADSGVVCDVMRAMKAWLPYPTNADSGAWTKFFLDFQNALFEWSFAVCTFFRLCGDDTFTPEDCLAEDHPPTRWRQASAVLLAREWIERFWDAGLGPVVMHALTGGAAEAERVYSLVCGEPACMDGLMQAFGEPGHRLLEMLHDHWTKELRDILRTRGYAKVQIPD
jgi:hypothetical protein